MDTWYNIMADDGPWTNTITLDAPDNYIHLANQSTVTVKYWHNSILLGVVNRVPVAR
jgi:hypothetical protein